MIVLILYNQYNLHLNVPVQVLTDYLLVKKTKMTRFSMFILFIIIPIAELFGQQLKGIVIDTETKLPLPYATVYIIDLEIATLTDSSGQFILSNSLPPFVKVKISSTGYESAIFLVSTNGEEHIFSLSEKHFEIDEVTISTTKGTMQKNNVVRVESRRLNELNAIANSSLGEAMTIIPGVYRSSTGPGISKPVIRGMQGIRVVTLLNGLRIENQQWGGDHGMGITELGIGSLEVIKGPSSLLYGADALGGVIYFIDEPYAKQNTFEIGVKTQNESNTLGTSNQLWYKQSKKNYRFNIAGSYSNHADYKLPNGMYAFNSRFSENALKVAFGTNRKNWAIHVRYNYSNSVVGIPGESEDSLINLMSFQVKEQLREKLTPFQTYKNHFFSVDNKWFFKMNEVSLLLGQTYNQLSEYEESFDTAAMNMNLWNSVYSFKIQTNLNEDWSLVSGIQGMIQQNYNAPDAEEKLLPNSESFDNGIFSIAYFQKRKWNFQAGLRYDNRTLESKEAIFKKNYQSFNFSSGFVRTEKKNTFRLNISSGFRAPHLSELLADGFHHGALRYEIGDRNLKSEKATQLDLTYEFHHEHFELIINPFFNYIQDYIAVKPIDSLIENLPVYTFSQINTVYLYGTDIGFHYHPHFAHWLHLESTFSLIQSESVNEDNIPLLPQNRINTFLKVKFKTTSKFKLDELTLQHTLLTKQSHIALYETESPSYQLFNAALSFKYNTKNPITFNVGVKNIFNEQYIDHLSRLKNIGLNQQARNVYFSVKFNLVG